MTLFILTETSAGYALLKAKDKKLLKRDDIAEEASTAEGVSNLYVNCVFQSCRKKKIRVGIGRFAERAQKISLSGTMLLTEPLVSS